jgi:hypothetical protein
MRAFFRGLFSSSFSSPPEGGFCGQDAFEPLALSCAKIPREGGAQGLLSRMRDAVRFPLSFIKSFPLPGAPDGLKNTRQGVPP